MLMNLETSGKALELQAGAVESADIALNHVKEVSSGSWTSDKHPLLIFGIAGNQPPVGVKCPRLVN